MKGGVNLLQIIRRALPHDADRIISGAKALLYRPPFNLRVPDVPEGVKPSPPWCNQSRYVSLLNIKAFPKLINCCEKKVVAFGATLNPQRSRGVEYRDELLKFMADVTSGIIPP